MRFYQNPFGYSICANRVTIKPLFFRRPFIMTCLAWNTTPSLATLCRAIEQHTAPLYLIVCLPENHIPDFPLSNHPSELEGRLNKRLVQAMKCLQFNSVNVLENLLPDVHLWLVPPHCADHLHEHFHHIEWQTEAIPPILLCSSKTLVQTA